MQQTRPTPFELAFETTARISFPAIQAAVEASGRDARDRDGFLLLRDVVTLLHDLRPDEGLGEGIDQLVALLHHAYLFWSAGAVSVEVPAELLHELLETPIGTPGTEMELDPRYVQLPLRRIWAQAVP